jgi:hypothetical protein
MKKLNESPRAAAILLNRIRTPDGTILTSRHRHDFVTHVDKNGKTYGVDGGFDYLKRIGDLDYEEMSVTSHCKFELIRYAFEWGNRGILGDQPVRYVSLQNMNDAHINAILDTQTHISVAVRETFKQELKFRKKHGIKIAV